MHPLACQQTGKQHTDLAAAAVFRVSDLLTFVSEVSHLTAKDPMARRGQVRSYGAVSQIEGMGLAAIWALGQ